MRETIRSGGLVHCDVDGCQAVFVTYSLVTLARGQAKGVGWKRLNGRKLSGGEPGVFMSRGKVDVCQAHGDLPAFEPAPKVKKPRKAQS